MSIELGIKLSYIEEIRERLIIKRLSLKNELKNYGKIRNNSRKIAIDYTNEMREDARKYYIDIKEYVEENKKSNKLAKQILRHMKSIDGYARKIYEICGYEYNY